MKTKSSKKSGAVPMAVAAIADPLKKYPDLFGPNAAREVGKICTRLCGLLKDADEKEHEQYLNTLGKFTSCSLHHFFWVLRQPNVFATKPGFRHRNTFGVMLSILVEALQELHEFETSELKKFTGRQIEDGLDMSVVSFSAGVSRQWPSLIFPSKAQNEERVKFVLDDLRLGQFYNHDVRRQKFAKSFWHAVAVCLWDQIDALRQCQGKSKFEKAANEIREMKDFEKVAEDLLDVWFPKRWNLHLAYPPFLKFASCYFVFYGRSEAQIESDFSEAKNSIAAVKNSKRGAISSIRKSILREFRKLKPGLIPFYNSVPIPKK